MPNNTKNTLRLHILSDLHLSMQTIEPPEVQADVCILAGDIARPQAAMEWASQIKIPVIYVAGNHEFYGNSIPAVKQQLAEDADKYGIHLLDKSAIEISGVRFLGATLWTDFNLYGNELRSMAMQRCAEFMRDYKVIKNADDSIFSPNDAAAIFREEYDWLDAELDNDSTETVVITHFAPCMRSVHPRFADSILSAGFVSDCLGLLGRSKLWIHGHTHDSFDYSVYGTRVICNPRGYYKDGNNENPKFDPKFCVEVPITVKA